MKRHKKTLLTLVLAFLGLFTVATLGSWGMTTFLDSGQDYPKVSEAEPIPFTVTERTAAWDSKVVKEKPSITVQSCEILRTQIPFGTRTPDAWKVSVSCIVHNNTATYLDVCDREFRFYYLTSEKVIIHHTGGLYSGELLRPNATSTIITTWTQPDGHLAYDVKQVAIDWTPLILPAYEVRI